MLKVGRRVDENEEPTRILVVEELRNLLLASAKLASIAVTAMQDTDVLVKKLGTGEGSRSARTILRAKCGEKICCSCSEFRQDR